MFGVTGGEEKVGRRILGAAAFRGQKLSHQMIIRLVLSDRLVQPLTKYPHAPITHVFPIAAQQVTPL